MKDTKLNLHQLPFGIRIREEEFSPRTVTVYEHLPDSSGGYASIKLEDIQRFGQGLHNVQVVVELHEEDGHHYSRLHLKGDRQETPEEVEKRVQELAQSLVQEHTNRAQKTLHSY